MDYCQDLMSARWYKAFTVRGRADKFRAVYE